MLLMLKENRVEKMLAYMIFHIISSKLNSTKYYCAVYVLMTMCIIVISFFSSIVCLSNVHDSQKYL